MASKDYQPTRATDENSQDRGTFQSPFLAEARSEQETAWGTTNGDWAYTPVNEKG